jgi:hypothetical protein
VTHIQWNKLHATRNTPTSTTDCKNWKGNLVAVIEMREIERKRLDAYILLSMHLFYYSGLLFLHSHHYWSISSREIVEERNGMEEGREGNTIIRKQYSTTYLC